MSTFFQTLIVGLRLGSIYALIALGYTMVYGIIRLINFAHGDFIMVGGYTMIFTIPLALRMGLPASVQGVFEYPMLVYAIVLIVVILFRPKGIFGTYEFSLMNLRRDVKASLARKSAERAERKGAKSHG